MTRRFGCLRWFLIVLVFAGVALSLALFFLARSNRAFPTASAAPEHLAKSEIARVAEAQHLRKTLGDAVWPEWDTAEIPVVLYNEEYAFLLGHPDPPPGWRTVPDTELQGEEWLLVDREIPLYFQPLKDGITPQAFTVMIGDRWAASLPTLEWFRISLGEKIRSEIPSPVARFVPLGWITGLFIGGSEGWTTLLLHETFHAWQGMVAPERVAEAERATALEDTYEKRMPAMSDAWEKELALLRDALEAETASDARVLAKRFTVHRRARREEMDPALIRYERQREWLEGLAKYVEIVSWREAHESDDYQPLLTESDDPDFEDYRGFERRWTHERSQLVRSANATNRFYYSGMAQAMLLDRISPGWKEHSLEGSISLDAMIAEASSASR